MNTEHKIAVLDRALELLGRKGEHWVQGYYYARRDNGGDPKRANPAWATDWCLAGACGQAAFELGVKPDRSGTIADIVIRELSLQEYAVFAVGQYVPDFNDNPDTSFLKIRRLVKGYMAELKGEPA